MVSESEHKVPWRFALCCMSYPRSKYGDLNSSSSTPNPKIFFVQRIRASAVDAIGIPLAFR